MVSNINEYDFENWNNRKFHADFINADGPQSFGLWPDSTINVHIRDDYEILLAEKDGNGFSETRDYEIYGPANSFMIKIWTDEDGNLYCDIAPKLRPATAWTHMQINEMILIGLLDVLQYDDLTQPISGQWLGEFVIEANDLNYFEFGSPW